MQDRAEEYCIVAFAPNDRGGPEARGIPYALKAPVDGIIELPRELPSRYLHRFAGWSGRGTVYQPGASFQTGTKSVVLYAQWARDLK